MATKSLLFSVIILALASPMLLGQNINVINNTGAPLQIDVNYVVGVVDPILNRIYGPPLRTATTITFEHAGGVAPHTSVCDGVTEFSVDGFKVVNPHDLTEAENQALIYEHIHAAYTPCSGLLKETDLVEAFASTLTRHVYYELGLDPGLMMTASSYAFQSVPWLVGGGTSSFYTQPDGFDCHCVADPMVRLGALTGGDFSRIRTAINNLNFGTLGDASYIYDDSIRRPMILAAIDSALAGKTIDGVLPSAFLREAKCSWIVGRETLPASAFSGQDVTFQTWSEVEGTDVNMVKAKHVAGQSGTVTTGSPIGDIQYTMTDATGQTVASVRENNVVVGGIRYTDSVRALPTGAYRRETCELTAGTSQCSSLKDVQYDIRWKESDRLGGGSVVIITNGPSFGQFSGAFLQLAGDSVGKFGVRRFPGLVVIDRVVGDVQVTDGTVVKTFTASPILPVIEHWKKFDDVVLLGVLNAGSHQPVESLPVGQSGITLQTVGASHTSPTYNPVVPASDKGCTGPEGVTRVVFTLGSGERQFGNITYCSWGRIDVLTPALPAGTVKVTVELNGVPSNAIQVGVQGVAVGRPPRYIHFKAPARRLEQNDRFNQ